MPLMKKLFPSRELEIERPISRASKISNFANFEYHDDSNLDSNMDAPVMNRSRTKKKPSMPKVPSIPRRSSKRISTILNNVVSELKCVDEFEATKQVVEEPEPEISDPHELYLSSEEDASLSDTDTLLDFEVATVTEYSGPRSSSRASAQDTARVISFTLVSKPRVIEIPRPTSFHSNPIFRNACPVTDYQIRHSVADIASLAPLPAPQPPRRSSRQSTPLRKSARRLSISTIGALSKLNTSHDNASSITLPQQPSKLNSGTNFLQPASATSNASPQHAFLSSDPFPSPTPSPHTENRPVFPEPEQNFQSRRPKSMHHERPKTPTSLMEGLQGLTRSFTKSAKKRPSMPKLNLAYTPAVVPTAHSNTSRSSLAHSNTSKTSLHTVDERTPKETKFGNMRRSSTVPLFMHEEKEKVKRTQESQSAIDEKVPVRYEDIMRNVIREAPPNPPITQQNTSSPGLKGWMGMGMGNRRKSMKGNKLFTF
ncbi:e68dd2a3-8d9a-437b-8c8c-58634addc0ec-CDS [Sclerotinia trifoliorum]|uniref:E68dd2a3-8d9a-437b-8c8c-58634addc0ec-CDS n=1 Tax=Sclerotinia trifoliorum TaxID=28548 RepID=A0A8H2VZ13_9HELO|nr:e68dd2a3-8d9a-437b-8c8c-58634addc0ec-CDS [Sclerotinia trifoliorum]